MQTTRMESGTSWRQTRRAYSHEIPKSIRITLFSYAEENEVYTLNQLGQELNIPVDLVGRYCRLLGIHTYYSRCENEVCLCGFRD